MQKPLYHIPSFIRQLASEYALRGEAVSSKEGILYIRVLPLINSHSKTSCFEVEVFSNILFGGTRIWEGNNIEELLEKVLNEVKSLVKEELSHPYKNILDIE